MTVCVAALAAESRVIVCVADKAISYGDYIQWDSDSSKIARINERGIAILMSGGEEGITKVLAGLVAVAPRLGQNVAETMKICEEEYKKAVDDAVESRFLAPRLIHRSEYIAGISGTTINPYFRAIAEEIDKFDMDCELLLCGFDLMWQPFIIDLAHPGIAADMTRTGFHAIGSGWEKATSKLLFSEYKRTSTVQRILYEVFDAKANAELDAHVGYEWDAVIVVRPPISFCEMPKEVKDLTERVWAQFNRSPFDRYNKAENLEPPPKNWKNKLEKLISSRVLAVLAKMEKETDETNSTTQ